MAGTALIAVGLISGEGHHDDAPAGKASSAPGVSAAETPSEDPEAVVRVRQLEQQVQELSEQLHHWQRRAEVAEARAEERARSLEVLRIANESERLALRMLTTGTHDQYDSARDSRSDHGCGGATEADRRDRAVSACCRGLHARGEARRIPASAVHRLNTGAAVQPVRPGV